MNENKRITINESEYNKLLTIAKRDKEYQANIN